MDEIIRFFKRYNEFSMIK